MTANYHLKGSAAPKKASYSPSIFFFSQGCENGSAFVFSFVSVNAFDFTI